MKNNIGGVDSLNIMLAWKERVKKYYNIKL
jgi:hypothetical protein